MKSVFPFLTALSITCIFVLAGCSSPTSITPDGYQLDSTSPARRFPYLIVYQSSLKNQDSFKTSEQFVFNSYDSTASTPWQLICYGQLNRKCKELIFTRLSAPFPIYSDTLLFPTGQKRKASPVDTTNFSVTNLDIKGSLFKQMVRDNKDSANVLVFKPYFDSRADSNATSFPPILQLRYTILLGRYQKNKKILTIIPFDTTQYDPRLIDLDNDGGINLNPCPPAHKDINE